MKFYKPLFRNNSALYRELTVVFLFRTLHKFCSLTLVSTQNLPISLALFLQVGRLHLLLAVFELQLDNHPAIQDNQDNHHQMVNRKKSVSTEG